MSHLVSDIFRAPPAAFLLPLDELDSKYELRLQEGAASRIFEIVLKSEAAIHAAGGGGGQVLNLRRLVKLSANPPSISMHMDLIQDPIFSLFARTTIGAENLKTKTKRAMHKAMFLNRGSKQMQLQSTMLKTSYWHESLLPSHPYGPDIQDYFDAWSTSRKITSSFEDWLSLKPPHLQPRCSVEYLNAEQRQVFEVNFDGGRLVHEGAPLCTNKFETDKKEPLAIYVLSTDYKFYIGPYKIGRFHHSSFLEGAPVLGAGEIRTDEHGKILVISSKSGHYKPTAMQLHITLDFLEKGDVDLSAVRLFENSPVGVTEHESPVHFRTSSPKPGFL